MSGFPTGYFKIRSRLTGKCLDINGGSTENNSRVVLFNCHDGLHQHWYIDKLGRIINRLSNKALFVKDSNKANGTPAVINEMGLGTKGVWEVDAFGRIKSKLNGKNLTFDENSINQSDMLPVYLWENYNGPTQKWYFERIGDKKETVELVKNHEGKKGTLTIDDDRIPHSSNLTVQFWMVLNSFKSGKWKHIYHKGASNTYPRTPGLWLYPKLRRFHVRASTTKSNNEGCDPKYEVPIGKWINVAHVISGRNVKLFVDGELVRECKLKGHPNPNSYPLSIARGGGAFNIKHFEYSNYALTSSEIEHNMKLKKPEFKLDSPDESPVKSGIKIVNMTSNNTYPPGKKSQPECDPFRGQLNQQSGWCAGDKENMKNYLEANFDQVYKVKTVLTQGRSTGNQWVTRYAVEYLDPITYKWLRYGTTFDGNKDQNTIAIRKVKFVTKSVRIYPMLWNKWPSMRIGFDGSTTGLTKCDTYLKESQDSSKESERKAALKKYNSECRKITFQEHLELLKKQKAKHDELYALVHKYKSMSNTTGSAKKNMAKNIAKLQKKIKELGIEVEIAKARKCPPKKDCLPVIAPGSVTQNKCDVNQFDIRTHQDFHKYVKATSVQSCEKATEKGSNEENKSLSSCQKKKEKQLLKKELDKCQSNFIEAFKKINTNNIMNMTGGGIYGKMCTISNSEDQTRNNMKKAYRNDDNPYSLDKHKDFQKILSSYKEQSDDIRDHRDYSKLVKKVKSQCKLNDITRHPDYKNLMTKFAIKDNTTCPPKYKPCPDPSTYITKKDLKEKYVGKKDAELTKLIEIRNKYKDLLSDIKKHPKYEKLVSKYAWKDNTTCPPTIMNCSTAIKSVKAEMNKTINQLKKQLNQKKKEVITAEEIIAPHSQEQVTSQKKQICKRAVKEYKVKHPEIKDITKHPDYEKLMKRVGCLDNTSCPPTYKKCKCPTIDSMDIKDHPNINKYILKTQMAKILKNQVSEEHNEDESAYKKQLILERKETNKLLAKLKSLKKKNKELKDKIDKTKEKYGWKDDTTCPPSWKPCEAPKNVGDFDISTHPDIDKYILKSQLPKLIDEECRKHFK